MVVSSNYLNFSIDTVKYNMYPISETIVRDLHSTNIAQYQCLNYIFYTPQISSHLSFATFSYFQAEPHCFSQKVGNTKSLMGV